MVHKFFIHIIHFKLFWCVVPIFFWEGGIAGGTLNHFWHSHKQVTCFWLWISFKTVFVHYVSRQKIYTNSTQRKCGSEILPQQLQQYIFECLYRERVKFKYERIFFYSLKFQNLSHVKKKLDIFQKILLH